MSKHNMTLAIPVNGGDDEIELVISYEFHREHGDYWNKGIGTWEPGEAASVEFLSAKRPSDVGPIENAHALEAMAKIYFVPYGEKRFGDAFEFYFRTGTAP